jgi:glycosyltransferase involved in cell wall biosynthesis
MTNDKCLFMRILHLTAGSDAGGVSRYIFDLCTAMQAAGHEVAVAGERGLWHERFAAAPWPWIEAPLKAGPLGLSRAVKILRKYLAEHPVDILHAHFRKSAIVGRRLQNQGRPPLLYTLHGSHIPLGGVWGWLSDFGDHVHVPSVEARQWLIDEAGVPQDRITLIPHGIHLERFPVPDEATRRHARAALELGEDNLAAVYLGRLEYQKNESWMIDLAEASKNELPNLRVLLAGEGPNEGEVKEQINQRGLSGRIQMLGHREPLPVLQAADALLLPSVREGFSYACAEAMCAGVPVLRTRTSGTKELIVEGVTGRSVEIDRAAFVREAIDFLSDRDALRRMGVSAAQHIRRNFTFENQLAQTLALYQKLI